MNNIHGQPRSSFAHSASKTTHGSSWNFPSKAYHFLNLLTTYGPLHFLSLYLFRLLFFFKPGSSLNLNSFSLVLLKPAPLSQTHNLWHPEAYTHFQLCTYWHWPLWGKFIADSHLYSEVTSPILCIKNIFSISPQWIDMITKDVVAEGTMMVRKLGDQVQNHVFWGSLETWTK